MHPNPEVLANAHRFFTGLENVHLIQPLDYHAFVHVMRLSTIIMTDSGGIQEEAPALGKPVMVLREKSERPEAVEAGTAQLAGTDVEPIESIATRLLTDRAEYERISHIRNPFGDGTASRQIADDLAARF